MATPVVSRSTHTPPPAPSKLSKPNTGNNTPSRSREGSTPAITLSASTASTSTNDSGKNWGSNFWVTLVDPQSGVAFFACPGTGQVSWDPPVGNYVMPPSAEGEWWELADESRSGLPYYYHTKTHETVWDKPEGFVIPLGILQNSAVGKRLSWSLLNGGQIPAGYLADVSAANTSMSANLSSTPSKVSKSPSKTHTRNDSGQSNHSTSSQGSANAKSKARRQSAFASGSAPASYRRGTTLSTIPGSPDVTEASGDDAGSQKKADTSVIDEHGRLDIPGPSAAIPIPPSRPRSKSYTSLPRVVPQSLSAVAAELASSAPGTAADSPPSPSPSRRSFGWRTRKSASSPDVNGPGRGRSSTTVEAPRVPETPKKIKSKAKSPVPAMPDNGLRAWRSRNANGSNVAVNISAPVLNREATANMSPVKLKAKGRPIPVGSDPNGVSGASASASVRPILPKDLVSDIEQFIEDTYAKQYFATHRAGFIFKRTIPLAQMMQWQKSPLHHSLLQHNRSGEKDAVKLFRSIQRIMGDREPERSSATALLEEQRSVLAEGISHGDLRDEIYCQVMKQLNVNPSPESAFKGWQFLCVLLVTFPPSKNFEPSLRAFIQQHTSAAHSQGRIDVIAKHCLKRLEHVSKKGPRGKPPTIAEIESASDAAFNPSIFGESLDTIMRLQQRTYPDAQVPIVLPFLTDGILALGGTRTEGIFRVPGDGDAVAALRVRLDRGQYTLADADDPHVPASALKLWLRELQTPLVPAEMYDACVAAAATREPGRCAEMVRRLPTVNRRVVLFLVSFLKMFLDERAQEATKMTPVNLALVMAPNLLRCESESMAVVFTNAQFEQMFVHDLLLHLKPEDVDPDYRPTHGMGVRGLARNT